MKKYGKYEKWPEGVPEKQPQVKSALLQTYFTSLLCLVLCVTMFFGTSYAWFTSEVENTGNEIHIGTLDVDLLLEKEGTSYSLKNNTTDKVFDGDTIHWEPGYTALRTLSVVNQGDLAFNYVLNFTNVSDTDVADVADVAQNFEVWVYSGSYSKSEGETFADMTKEKGWTKVDTLAEVLAGKAVFSGSVTAEDIQKETGSQKTTHTYTIALHMKEDAENTTDESGKNSLMGQKISLNVKLVAYQMGSEPDAFGTQHDQMVATAEELQTAFNNGGTVALAANITLEDSVEIPAGKNVVLDLNGHTLSGTGATGYASMLHVSNTAKLTIADSEDTGKITYAGDNSQGAIVDLEGELVLESSTLEMTGTWDIGYAVDVRPNAWRGTYEATTFTMNGGKIITSENSAAGAVRVTSSSVANYRGASSSFVMNGGEIDVDKDGIFVQVWQPTVEPLKVTVNGGTIKSDLHVIRIYAANVMNEIEINLSSDANLAYDGDPAAEVYLLEEALICCGGTASADKILAHTTITIDGVEQQ